MVFHDYNYLENQGTFFFIVLGSIYLFTSGRMVKSVETVQTNADLIQNIPLLYCFIQVIRKEKKNYLKKSLI